jgi:hypothetical protein
MNGALMSHQWFYEVNGERIGPVTAQHLKQLVHAKGIQATTRVWREGLMDWVEARKIAGLFSDSAPTVSAQNGRSLADVRAERKVPLRPLDAAVAGAPQGEPAPFNRMIPAQNAPRPRALETSTISAASTKPPAGYKWVWVVAALFAVAWFYFGKQNHLPGPPTPESAQPTAEERAHQAAVRRARSFLDSQSVGRDILSFVHMGARYDGHEFLEQTGLAESPTAVRPGFGLVYRFNWEGDGRTEVAFICDTQGNVCRVQILHSNGVFNYPFGVSKLSIDILGSAVMEAFKDQMGETQQAELQALISKADPKSLLEMKLKLQQPRT